MQKKNAEGNALMSMFDIYIEVSYDGLGSASAASIKRGRKRGRERAKFSSASHTRGYIYTPLS
jgi:hypothetical protein